VNDTLKTTLRDVLRSGTDSNPALNVLIDDYTKYHVVLVVVGGLFLLGLALLSIFFWSRFTRAPRHDTRKWTFEKKTYFSFGILSVLVALFMALVVAGNVSNVLNPRNGFEGAIGMLSASKAGTRAAELHQPFTTWLTSGSEQVPSAVQGAIDDRLSWQRPKAIICSVLLVLFLVLSVWIWRRLIRTSRVPGTGWGLKRAALLMLGVVTVAVCLLLMLMVIGNTQGSIAPISLTLFYG
jgi:hypothetical protein